MKDQGSVPGKLPPAKGRSSSYSTRGGGVVLEHRYGALILSHLLTGDPVPELDDGVLKSRYRFSSCDQQRR